MTTRKYIENAKARKFQVPSLITVTWCGETCVALQFIKGKPDETILDYVRKRGFRWDWEKSVWVLSSNTPEFLRAKLTEAGKGKALSGMTYTLDTIEEIEAIVSNLGGANTGSLRVDADEFRLYSHEHGYCTTTYDKPTQSEILKKFGPGSYRIKHYKLNSKEQWAFYKAEGLDVFPESPQADKVEQARAYHGLHGSGAKDRLDAVAKQYRDTLAETREEVKTLERKLTAANIDLTFQQACLDKKDAEITVLRSELGERYQGAAAKADPVSKKGVAIRCQNDEDGGY